MKDNGLTLEKGKKKTIHCTNYYGRRLRRWHSASGKCTHPVGIPAAYSGAGVIGFHAKADKTVYICFNQISDIATLNDGPLKLVDTYIWSSAASKENDINTRLAKMWTVVDWLLVIWKLDLSDKIKRRFFPSSGRVHTTVWMYHMDADKAYRDKAWRQLHKDTTSYIKQILEAASHKTAAVVPPTTHLEDH